MQFGYIMKRKREEHGLTQTDLAQRIGTTQQNINSYFGVPIEKAREMLPEMTTAFGGDE